MINHLKQDALVDIEQINSDALEDGLINKDELIDICETLLESINTSKPQNSKEILIEKLSKIKPIADKKHFESLPLSYNNSLIEFSGLFSIFEIQKQNIIEDYEDLFIEEGNSIELNSIEDFEYQSLSSIETDPSQQEILNSLSSTRNILIQGPPGTGKSQSLTAILVNALENEKKVLVVCEKKTALEVLQNSLEKIGLAQHCTLIIDIVKDRKKVVDSVRDRIDYYRTGKLYDSKYGLENLTSKLENIITNINNGKQKIYDTVFANKDRKTLVGEILRNRRFISDIDINEFKFSKLNLTPNELDVFVELLAVGEKKYLQYKNNIHDTFINPDKFGGSNLFVVENDFKNAINDYRFQLKKINEDFESYKLFYKDEKQKHLSIKLAKIELLLKDSINSFEKIKGLIKEIKEQYILLRKNELKQQVQLLNETNDKVKSLLAKYENDSNFLNNDFYTTFSFKFKSLFSDYYKKIKVDINELNNLFTILSQNSNNCKDLNNYTFTNDFKFNKNHFIKFENEFSTLQRVFSQKVDREIEFFKIDSFLDEEIGKQSLLFDIELLESELFNEYYDFFNDKTLELENEQKSLIKSNSIVVEYIKFFDFIDVTTLPYTISKSDEIVSVLSFNLTKSFSQIESEIIEESKSLDLFTKIEERYQSDLYVELKNRLTVLIQKIDNDNWFIDSILEIDEKNRFKTVEELIIKSDNYIKSDSDIFSIEYNWNNYLCNLSKEYRIIVNQLLNLNNWDKTFYTIYLNNLLIENSSNELLVDDENHINYQKLTKDFKPEQLHYINSFWINKQINYSKDFKKDFKNLAVENLYNKKSGNKFKRLSLRKVIEFDLDLFSTFFPIILTTPDVSSNLFKNKNKYFDIVIFDEASQLKIEDNLPALLKGKQIVIAGDEHQMPPSNYFSKIFDGDVEDYDDETIGDEGEQLFENSLLSAESLLEFAEELNFEKKYLDFHYRSQHPFLIEFSNNAFYNGRLKPLPNKFEYTPIKYINVNGTYSEHSNDVEAETILSIIENNVKRLPDGKYPTVGIATFNIHQRNLILGKINERKKFDKYSEFNEKISELEDNGFFVKNLENIQGDERDIIIITTTYGIDKNGKFNQRFGSINQVKGYKLLNVIITRAKYKVYLCTSVPEDVILNYKSFLLAEGSNNRRAVFYSYLAYCKFVSERNEDERLSVLKTLAENTNNKSTINILEQNLESPFEEEVYSYMLDYFKPENIITQYEFTGFRIDLVYVSSIPNVPKIAIECDGAMYHSSTEAYLYDMHRQKILESHGFIFHRIWSTNWWRNSKSEIKKLVSFIKGIEEKYSQITIENDLSINDLNNITNAFTDDIQILMSDESSLFTNDNDLFTEKYEECDEYKIKVGDIVNVKYLNENKNITVQILEDEIDKNEQSETIKKISEKSALGVALLGKSLGQTVKVGTLDNFVEIISIN